MSVSSVRFLGYLGAAILVSAYFASSRSELFRKSWWYHLTNLAGAIGIAVNAGQVRDFPALILNAFWCVAALLNLMSAFLVRTAGRPRDILEQVAAPI